MCKKKEEKSWREEEEWRTIDKKREKSLVLKLAQQVSNFFLVQNEVTNWCDILYPNIHINKKNI